MAEVEDSGESETEEAVSGIRLEFGRLLRDGSEILVGDSNTADGYCGHTCVDELYQNGEQLHDSLVSVYGVPEAVDPSS